MAFLQAVVPIIRGQCDGCGAVRNLWISELSGDEGIPCSHRDRGCSGSLQVVYRGPKAWLPADLADDVRCRCGRGQAGAAGSGGGSGGGGSAGGGLRTPLEQLLDMGFPRPAASQALARCANDPAAAVDWLTGPGGAAAAAAASGSASLCAAPGTAELSAAAASAASGGALDLGECAICCEDLLLVDAAMRCLGHGGKKHYFHARCLAAWVRECQLGGSGATCPECRGPVQVRPRRLEEFLQDKGSKLDTEDRQALRSFRAAADGSSDDDGWANVKRDFLIAGALVGVGIGLAVAIAAGLQAMSSSRGRNAEQRDERR